MYQNTAISQISSELNHIIQTDKIPNALIFTGKKNTGKEHAALEFAKACNCSADAKSGNTGKPGNIIGPDNTMGPEIINRPCNLCLSCKKINSGMHPDIIRISLAEKKKNITIAQIREMGLMISARPNEAAMRMVLVSDADLMNVQAQNALLKMLEEPPKNTFFILTATGISTLLPTIISRCRKIRFKPLSENKIQEYIVQQCNQDPKKVAIATKTAGSDLKKAMMFLNLSLDLQITDDKNAGDKRNDDKKPMLKNKGIEKKKTDWQKRRTWIIKELFALISGHNNGIEQKKIIQKGLMLSQRISLEPDLIWDTLNIIRTILRDLCIFKYSPEKIVNLDFFEVFTDISGMYTYNTFPEWVKDLYDTEKRLKSNSSMRLTLDRFFLKLSSL